MPKILFVSATSFYPESCGGPERFTLHLLKSLQGRGWEIEMFCGLPPSSPCLRSLEPRRWYAHFLLQKPPLFAVKDTRFRYPCWRLNGGFGGFLRWFDKHLRRFRPDVVLCHTWKDTPLLRHAARRNYFSACLLQDVLWIRHGFRLPEEIALIANSPFTAAEVLRIYGRSIPVIPGLVEPGCYRAHRRRRRYVTFINPIPEKGVKIALEIARRLPRVPFLFVRGKWLRYESAHSPFLRSEKLPPNIVVWSFRERMRPIYAVTDILLVPSQWPETFGRVILEAHSNGIPVVAAKVGGIPYTLGDGGILVAPKDNAQGYLKALKQLRSDRNLYRRISARALKNSRRPEFDPERQVDQFVSFVEERIG